MRENCTYGLTRGRAYPTRGALLYSTSIDTPTPLRPLSSACAAGIEQSTAAAQKIAGSIRLFIKPQRTMMMNSGDLAS